MSLSLTSVRVCTTTRRLVCHSAHAGGIVGDRDRAVAKVHVGGGGHAGHGVADGPRDDLFAGRGNPDDHRFRCACAMKSRTTRITASALASEPFADEIGGAVGGDPQPDTIVIIHVESRPSSPDRDQEYNTWYDEVHIPELVALDGFVSARRLRPSTATGPTSLSTKSRPTICRPCYRTCSTMRGTYICPMLCNSIPLAGTDGLRIQGVTVKHRLGKRHLGEAEVSDDGAQRQLSNRQPTRVDRVNIEFTSRSPRNPGCSAAHAASRCSDWVFIVSVVNNTARHRRVACDGAADRRHV